MEIKILCTCGTKFKFEVEPVNGRMPAPVNCPGCGFDATAQANSIIQSTLSPGQEGAAPNPPAPAPGRLRIHRPTALPAESPTGAIDGEASSSRAAPTQPAQVSRAAEPKSPLMRALTLILVVACIGVGAWQFGYKWFKRARLVAQVASAVGATSEDSGESGGAKNLWYEDCAVLLIKQTNHVEVAEACKDFWKNNLHKNLTLVNSTQEYENPGEYQLVSAHNGYVRIVGAHDWPVPQHEALALYLSQRLATLVFEWRSEHFADTYHFGVYDQGTRKFHAQMDIKISQDNAEEIVTTDGNDFAVANGYIPGPKGFDEFNVLDADRITQRLGMKLWDEKEGTEMKGILLKDGGPPAGPR